jgi:short-subunit dehydrogenase
MQNKNCWIIGCSSGIGKELAIKLYSVGYNICLSARNKPELLLLKQQLNLLQLSNTVEGIECDVANATSFDLAFNEVLKNFSCLDLAIFASGIYQPTSLANFSRETAKQIIDTNLLGAAYFFEIVGKKMLAQKHGHLAVIASVAGYFGMPQSGVYGASKAGLINLCQGFYPELLANKVHLSIINPGFVESRLTAKNKFAMPNIISSKKAAEYIFTGLQKKQFEIHFPKTFTFLLKFLNILPYFLLLPIIRKLYLKL